MLAIIAQVIGRFFIESKTIAFDFDWHVVLGLILGLLAIKYDSSWLVDAVSLNENLTGKKRDTSG